MIAVSASEESPVVALAEAVADAGVFVSALDVVSDVIDAVSVPVDCMDVINIVEVAAAVTEPGEDRTVAEAAMPK